MGTEGRWLVWSVRAKLSEVWETVIVFGASKHLFGLVESWVVALYWEWRHGDDMLIEGAV